MLSGSNNMNFFSCNVPLSDLFCCGRFQDFRSEAKGKELIVASERITSREAKKEIVVPDDCDLLQAFTIMEDDSKLVIRAGEYEWGGQVSIQRSGLRIDGEDGTILVGSFLLKAGSSGTMYNLEVIEEKLRKNLLRYPGNHLSSLVADFQRAGSRRQRARRNHSRGR